MWELSTAVETSISDMYCQVCRYTSVMYGYITCDINSKIFLTEILLIGSGST